MSAAAVTFLEGRKVAVANVEMKVSFTAPAQVGGNVTATAWVVKGGRRVAFLESELRDDAGLLVLKASSTFLYTDLPSRPRRRLAAGWPAVSCGFLALRPESAGATVAAAKAPVWSASRLRPW